MSEVKLKSFVQLALDRAPALAHKLAQARTPAQMIKVYSKVMRIEFSSRQLVSVCSYEVIA